MTEKKEKTKQEVRRVSDVVGGGEINFYPEAEKVSLDEVIDIGDIILIDAVIIEGFETKYGAHDLALVAFKRFDDDTQYTTATSGMVTVKKLRKLIDANAFSITGAFVNTGKYYDLI